MILLNKGFTHSLPLENGDDAFPGRSWSLSRFPPQPCQLLTEEGQRSSPPPSRQVSSLESTVSHCPPETESHPLGSCSETSPEVYQDVIKLRTISKPFVMPKGTCRLHLCPAPAAPLPPACPKPQACRDRRSFGGRVFSNQESARWSSHPPPAAAAWAHSSAGPTWP